MFGSSSAERHVDARDNYRQSFLASHRALSACTRELARLSDEIVQGVEALLGAGVEHKAVVRQSPERCIVQLGPVALTLAWLRSSQDSVATGELLIMVWRGAVAPRTQHQPERPSKRPAPLPATLLWEQVFAAVGESEASWAWQSQQADTGRVLSSELAARCVNQLRTAYLETGENDQNA